MGMKAMKAMKAGVRAMSKSGMADSVATTLSLKRRDVTKVMGALAELGSKEVKSVGKFAIPGLCMIKTKKKPATKAGMKMMFGKEVKVAAKPAKTVVKAFCNAKIKKGGVKCRFVIAARPGRGGCVLGVLQA